MNLLVLTKISRPRTTRYHLGRPELTSLLTEGLQRRLTALVAAAGHGKTSSLAHFLAERETPYLWIQLDAQDSSPSTFLRYLGTGIQMHLGGGQRLLQAFEQDDEISDPLPLLVSDLADCPGPVAIVLDDFHLIDKESPVVHLVVSLLQYAGDHVHVYICSRTPLPFSIARLKVMQEAGEITEEALRFTPDEVNQFMSHQTGFTISADQLAQLFHLTEGWSAALVPLAFSLKRRGTVENFLNDPLPSDLFAYLADEYFNGLAADVQGFMEESSVLDTATTTLCDTLLGRQDSEQFVTYLLSSNLLVTAVGPNAFRYHHLLQLFLQERLKLRDSGVTFQRIACLAGDHFMAIDLPEEAVQYFVRGDEIQRAAEVVEGLAPVWLRTSHFERLHGLLTHLPAEAKRKYPWISLCEARMAANAGNMDGALGMARLALTGFENQEEARGIILSHILIGEVHLGRQNYDQATKSYQVASALLRPDLKSEEGLLLQRRAALTVLTKGAGEEAEIDLRRALALYVELGDPSGEAAVSTLLGLVRGALGDYASTLRLLERAADIHRFLGDPPHTMGVHLAWAYNQVGRFRDAATICEPLLASSSRKLSRAHASTYLLHSYARLGDFTRAAATAQIANALVEELSNRELRSKLTLELAGLYRLSGQGQTSIPYANEAMQMAKHTERANLHVEPVTEASLLHLFQTGNAPSATRMAEKALARMGSSKTYPYERMMLTLIQAVAEFRQSRTESRPEAVRILSDGLSVCRRRGYEFFALHEWPLALVVVVYSLAYGVQVDMSLDLIRLLDKQLPESIRATGIALMEPEARLVPSAWHALPDETAREAFERLLTPSDHRRVVSLATGPALIQIRCMGALDVMVGADSVDVKLLRKRKSGNLLAFLLTHESPLPREQVIDRMWPDQDPKDADTSLRVALHHLRRLLEPHLGGRSKSRYIQAEGGLIWFSRQPETKIDLDQFRTALIQAAEARAAGDLKLAAEQTETACKVYRGDLSLDDPYALEDERRSLRNQYFTALDWLGDYYCKEPKDPPKAILALKQRLVADETYEPAHQALMHLYLDLGQVAVARQQYVQCREALRSQLGVLPARETEALFHLIMSRESEPATRPESPGRAMKSSRQ